MRRTETARSALVRPAVPVTVLALAANLALLVGGRAAGASFQVPDRGEPGALLQVGAGAVALSTLIPLMVGLAATALLHRRWPRARRALAGLAVVVTLASLGMPLSVATDTGTRVLLATMHLVVAGAYLAALRGLRPVHTAHATTAAAGSER